jgi:hypothetical protein
MPLHVMMSSLAIQYTPHPTCYSTHDPLITTPSREEGVLPTVKEAAALALAYGIYDGQRVGTAARSVCVTVVGDWLTAWQHFQN